MLSCGCRQRSRTRTTTGRLWGTNASDSNPKISFCIGVMNRLPHLKKTLLKNLEATKGYNVEFVILNYNSTDGFHAWAKENLADQVKNGRVAYYHEKHAESWHMARVKNLVHRMATGDILVNLDGDNYISPDLCAMLLKEYKRNKNLLMHGWSGVWKDGTCGRVAVSREALYKLGGYDEEFLPYGREELDFIERSYLMGIEYVRIPWHATAFALEGDHKEPDAEIHSTLQNTLRSHDNLLHGRLIANLKKGWGEGKLVHGFESTEEVYHPAIMPADIDEELREQVIKSLIPPGAKYLDQRHLLSPK